MTVKQKIQMYWGDNGAQEFWQDEFVGVLIERHEDVWRNSNGKTSGNLPVVITTLEKALGVILVLNTKRIWTEPRDENQSMVLREVG